MGLGGMKMKRTDLHFRQTGVFLLLILAWGFLGGCAGPRASGFGAVNIVYPEDRAIDIELKSFSFQPDHIAILEYQSPIVFRLTNTANIIHNFTLIDRHRIIIANVDLGPGESTTIEVRPLSYGNYTFYCNRFLHRRFGKMEGMLMVLPQE